MHNLRPFLSAMRPWRALLIAAIYSAIAWLQLHVLLHQPPAVVALNLCGIIIPAFWASLVAGGLHGIMHRVGFPLLPGAVRHARTAYLFLAGVGFAASLLIAASISQWTYLPAVAGLHAVFATLPLLNPRKRPLYKGLFNPWFPILFSLMGVLIIYGSNALLNAAVSMPWLILCGGAAFAVLVIRHTFARERIRQRQETHFVSVLGTLAFNPAKMVENGQFFSKELLRHNACVPTRQRKLPRASADTETTWMRRMEFAQHGRGTGTPTSAMQMILLTLLILVPMTLIMITSVALIPGMSLQSIASTMVDFARDGSMNSNDSTVSLSRAAVFMMSTTPFFIPMIGLGILRLRPRTWMPIPRHMQARIVFRNASGMILCYQPATLLPMLLTLGCALYAGIPLAPWMAMTTFAITVLVLPLQPLLVCSSLIPSNALRIIAPGLGMILAAIATGLAPHFSAKLLTPLPIVLSLTLTASGFWLLKRQVYKRFLREDLIQEMAKPV